jgi:NADH:ubiquinone oxidoreductase subunit 6 (subunit J)
MTTTAVLGEVFGAICVIAAAYAAFSRDLLRVSIAFFVELAAVSGVLLTLNADYLALVVFCCGLMGTILVISFSSAIMGSLKTSFRNELEGSGGSRLARAFGMALGLAVGAAIGWALLTAPFVDVSAEATVAKEPDVHLLGKMMLGEQVAVFELLGVVLLVVVVGAGLLLRRDEDAN